MVFDEDKYYKGLSDEDACIIAENPDFWKEAEQEELKYYADHIPELVKRIKSAVKDIVKTMYEMYDTMIVSSSRETAIFALGIYGCTFHAITHNDTEGLKAQIIRNLSLQLALLKDKAPKEHESILKFIDATIKKTFIIQKITPMPTGMSINTCIFLIDASQNGKEGLKALVERKKRISRAKYEVTHGSGFPDNRSTTTIRHDISKGYVSIQIPDVLIAKLAGHSVAVKKILVLVLQKINEQAYQDGHLTRNYIEFPVKEVVERGIYGTSQSALRGLKNALSCLTNFKIEGELTFSKKKDGTIKYYSGYGLAVLFPTVGYKNGQCHVRLNGDVDWRFIFQAYSRLPDYYFSLSNRASELCYLICATARQHTDDIKERGHFNISFRAIQQALNLPDEDKTTHPKQDIKDVINDAIDTIEKTHREYFGNDEDLLFLSAEYDDSWPIARFLNEGYLQVSLSGELAQPFIDFEDDKTKKKKEAKRRQRKALEAKNKEAKNM